MVTVHQITDISPEAAPPDWLTGFTNEDGSQMSQDQYDDMWENRTPPADLAGQIAAGEWGPLLQTHYLLRAHLDAACALLP